MSRGDAARQSATPRLYLSVPATIEPARFVDICDFLTKANVAAVLVRLADTDPRTQTERIKAFASLIQPSGAALLVDGHADLVARGGADGAHLGGIASMQEARLSLQPQHIAGVGGLATRHDAMLAGEAGVDYVLFGEPARDGSRPATEAVAERIAWWSEIFEVPCVAYAATPEDVALLASAGADFLMVEQCIWSDPRSAAAALMDARQAIGQTDTRLTAADSR